MRRYLPHLIVTFVGLMALTGGTLLFRAKRIPALKLSEEQLARARQGTAGAHVRGEPGASVTLEEFGDLQCQPCAILAGVIDGLEKTHAGRLRVIFRHFPIITHEHAREAALAAEAAGLQGRFWEMHDLLYREQAAWSKAPAARELFESYAGTLGLDRRRFHADLDGELVKARVDADAKRGVDLGVKTTPTIFVDAVAVPPDLLRGDRLQRVVAEAIRSRTH